MPVKSRRNKIESPHNYVPRKKKKKDNWNWPDKGKKRSHKSKLDKQKYRQN